MGVGGSGKQSLSRLAAYTAGCEVFEITLTRGYDEVAFREDLKKLYSMLGQVGHMPGGGGAGASWVRLAGHAGVSVGMREGALVGVLVVVAMM